MHQTEKKKKLGCYLYSEKDLLGEGAYGKVYEGIDSRTNLPIAIKRLDIQIFEQDQYIRKQIIQEIEIMKKFDHQHIVKFLQLVVTKKSLYIVTELCGNGDLQQLLNKKNLEEAEALQILKQLINGFKELYNHGIVHRDLKPANILIHESIIKIGAQKDFGFAKYVEHYSSQLLRSCVGSPLYMAPQLLASEFYTTKCDIWSLGIIFYEMLFQEVPWLGRDEKALLQNIKTNPLQLEQKEAISSFSRQFLEQVKHLMIVNSQTLRVGEQERITWESVFAMFKCLEPAPLQGLLKYDEPETVQSVSLKGNVNIDCLQIPFTQAIEQTRSKKIEEVNAQMHCFNEQREKLALLHFVIA